MLSDSIERSPENQTCILRIAVENYIVGIYSVERNIERKEERKGKIPQEIELHRRRNDRNIPQEKRLRNIVITSKFVVVKHLKED